MRIGVDIGGMSVKIGLVEGQGIVSREVIKTDSDGQTLYELIEKIADVVEMLLHKNKLTVGECDGLGIACPGTVDAESGTVTYSNNIGWENVPILGQLRQRFNILMALANDADAAAFPGADTDRSIRKGSSQDRKRRLIKKKKGIYQPNHKLL